MSVRMVRTQERHHDQQHPQMGCRHRTRRLGTALGASAANAQSTTSTTTTSTATTAQAKSPNGGFSATVNVKSQAGPVANVVYIFDCSAIRSGTFENGRVVLWIRADGLVLTTDTSSILGTGSAPTAPQSSSTAP